jgi:hypothetical protein
MPARLKALPTFTHAQSSFRTRRCSSSACARSQDLMSCPSRQLSRKRLANSAISLSECLPLTDIFPCRIKIWSLFDWTKRPAQSKEKSEIAPSNIRGLNRGSNRSSNRGSFRALIRALISRTKIAQKGGSNYRPSHSCESVEVPTKGAILVSALATSVPLGQRFSLFPL